MFNSPCFQVFSEEFPHSPLEISPVPFLSFQEKCFTLQESETAFGFKISLRVVVGDMQVLVVAVNCPAGTGHCIHRTSI